MQEALPKILKKIPDVNVHAVLAAAVDQKDGQDISLLLKRLRHFCRRNTTDYFIHKNLEGFLKRELEFFIKDQVLHLSDLDGDLESKRRTLRVFRELAEEVITFLAQIENVQKRLFEKRKFVLRTDYLVPIKEVPRELWKEVLSNKEQLKTWKDLFAIEPPKKAEGKEDFLKQHPTLVVNTAYFPPEFRDKLLASFSDAMKLLMACSSTLKTTRPFDSWRESFPVRSNAFASTLRITVRAVTLSTKTSISTHVGSA